jgi:hypothetical protein
MLIVLAFSYLVRSGKLKRTTDFFKNSQRKVKLKIAKIELAKLSGFQTLG